jgi:tryptophan-rich sensory protein
MREPETRALPWLASAIAAGAVAALGARAGPWHDGLVLPAWTPPTWIAVPLSAAMYVLMGIAAWLVWRESARAGVTAALALYAAQLACNVLWSFLFFGMRALDLAMLDLSVLWALVVLTARAFHGVRPLAGWLLAPYLAWVTFAAGLNLSIWLRNP